MGNPANLTPEARAMGPITQREAAIVATQQAAAFAKVLRAQGNTLQAVAITLNASGFRSRQGGLWSPTQVKRMLVRLL